MSPHRHAGKHEPERLKALEIDLAGAVRGEVRFDEWSRMLYATDASIYQIMPLGVVLPVDEQDVVATVQACASHGVPVLPRGDGSSLAGQSVGEAVVLDFSRYMDGLLALDEEGRRVRVQPGLNLSRLNRLVGAKDLMYGPDPASADRATVGGVIGNNATGAHSILYGMTVDHVEGLRVVLADGSVAVLENVKWEEARRRAGKGTLEAAAYTAAIDIASHHRSEIEAVWPRTWRRVGGYNLDRLLHGSELNLAHLVTGSEGTLCTIVEAELGLVPRPAGTSLAVLSFDTLLSALATVPAMLALEPSAIELMDAMLMDLCRRSPQYARRLTFVEGVPEATLVVEVYGEDERERLEHLERLAAAARSAAEGPVGVRLIGDETEQANVWEVRKAGLGLLMSRRGDHKPIPFVEDTAVPAARLRDYIADVLALLREEGTQAAFYAHASAGCLHVRPLIDLKQGAEVAKMALISEGIAELVLAHGGAMSGEHGDGLARSALNPRIYGERVQGLFENLKDAFDPAGIMNPGKIVRAAPMTHSLRFGPGYSTSAVEPTTWFDFSSDGGFARAVEMCSGSGVCRKRDVGTMCPSFMALREEEHSTRGRANALRAVLSGRAGSRGMGDERLRATLDLCLGCKACVAECPSGVDMSRLKSEFLAHYHQAYGVGLRDRLFGEVARLSRIGSALAPASNAILGLHVVRALLERFGGIDRRRTLPKFERGTFRRRFGRRQFGRGEKGIAPSSDRSTGTDRPSYVWLLADTFTNHNEPEVGLAAVRVIEAAGFAVRLLPMPAGCCGRPQLSRGLLPRVREMARENTAMWSRLVSDGAPIVGVEPSCLLTLRDEYPSLLPCPESRRVAERAMLLEEWLVAGSAGSPAPVEWLAFRPPTDEDEARLLVHGHCHSRALTGDAALDRLLGVLPQTRVERVDAGCCGMAGSFGYEPEHHELSMAIGAQRLFPAIRALGDAGTVVAAGTSCRHQIRDGTGRGALHPAEVLAARLERGTDRT